MISPLHSLQELVLSAHELPVGTADPFLTRVRNALNGLHASRSVPAESMTGSSDLVALLRQGVLRAHLARGDAPRLRVPQGHPWPTEAAWKNFGCTVQPAGVDHFLIEPQAWI